MRLINCLILLFSGLPVMLFAQTDIFSNWEKLTIPSRSIGLIYHKDGQLATLQKNGIYTSVDLGKHWTLDQELPERWNVLEEMTLRHDGIYLGIASRAGDAWWSPRFTAAKFDQEAEAIYLQSHTTVPGPFQGQSSITLSAHNTTNNEGSSMVIYQYNPNAEDVVSYRIFDGMDHFSTDVENVIGDFQGKVADRYLWRVDDSFSLLDQPFENEAMTFPIPEATDFVLVTSNEIFLLEKNGAYQQIDAMTLEISNGQIPVAVDIIEARILSSLNLEIENNEGIFHYELASPNNLEKVLNANSSDYNIVETTTDWVLGKTEFGNLALTTDKGETWEEFIPMGLDYVIDLDRNAEHYWIQNIDTGYTAACDLIFNLNPNPHNESSIEFADRIFRIENGHEILYSENIGQPFTPFPLLDNTLDLEGFVINNDRLYAYGNKIVEIDIENLSYEIFPFEAHKAKSYNGIIYGINSNKLLSFTGTDQLITVELFSETEVEDFFVDYFGIGIFANDFFLSEDEGDTFTAYDYPSIELNNWHQKGSLIVGRSDKSCDHVGVISLDGGKNWDTFLVPNVSSEDPSSPPWGCNVSEGIVRFGFRSDETYLYALGGLHGVHRTPLYSDLQTELAQDSLVYFCQNDSVFYQGEWYSEETQVSSFITDADDCSQLFITAIQSFEITNDTIELSLTAGETYLDIVINNDTILQVSEIGAAGCEQITTYIISVVSAVHNFYLAKNSFSLFPNPLHNDELQVTWKEKLNVLSTSIFNSTGQLVLLHENQRNGAMTMSNLSNFPAGIYYIQIKTAQGLWIDRFIKS